LEHFSFGLKGLLKVHAIRAVDSDVLNACPARYRERFGNSLLGRPEHSPNMNWSDRILSVSIRG